MQTAIETRAPELVSEDVEFVSCRILHADTVEIQPAPKNASEEAMARVVPDLRHALHANLHQLSQDLDIALPLDNIDLICSEMGQNAVRYGRGVQGGAYAIIRPDHAERTDCYLMIGVQDATSTMQRLPQHRKDELEEHLRGYMLMSALSDHFGFMPPEPGSDGGKWAWALFAIPLIERT